MERKFDAAAIETLANKGWAWWELHHVDPSVEASRARLARQLATMSDDEVRALFRAARFPEHYAATDDAKDLDARTAVFRSRVEQVVSAGPCPD